MVVTTLRTMAGPLALAGAWGTVSMALYKAALRHVDSELIPASAMPRVRWWSTHASTFLIASWILSALGLVLLAAT